MTEQNQANLDEELALLKQQADLMGIPYKSNISARVLAEKIKTRLEAPADDEDDAEDDEPVVVAKANAPVRDTRTKEQKIREAVRAEALPLVRCKIYNLNPAKNDLDGEIITVGNRYIGTVSKMIPFGEASEAGYHIPRIIYNDLISRKFQAISIKRDPRTGNEEVVRRMVPEYNVVVLPALTKEELTELAVRQAAAERLGA